MEENVSDYEAGVADGGEYGGLSRLPDQVKLALADIREVAREGLSSVTAELAVLRR